MEIGRELSVDDLVFRTIYVLEKSCQQTCMIAWYLGRPIAAGQFLDFYRYMGVTNKNQHLLLIVHKDGYVIDNTGTQIRIFECIGFD